MARLDVTEIRKKANLSKRAFARKYEIPYSTLCSWEYGDREAPEYLLKLLDFKVEYDMKEIMKAKSLPEGWWKNE